MGSRPPSAFWILEDTSTYHERERSRVTASDSAPPIAMRLYRVRRHTPELVAETKYVPRADGRSRDFRGALALDLLRQGRVRKGIVVAGSRFMQGRTFLKSLSETDVDFVVALPISSQDDGQKGSRAHRHDALVVRLAHAEWRLASLVAPDSAAQYAIADLGRLSYAGVKGLRCVALATGGIAGFRRGLVAGLSSLNADVPTEHVAYLLGWSRWVRFVDRRYKKSDEASARSVASSSKTIRAKGRANQLVSGLSARSNQAIARKQDLKHAAHTSSDLFSGEATLRGQLSESRSRLNVVELFAGAGGMGLGFLMGGQLNQGYRILFSGEIDPVYANTLRLNHQFLRARRCLSDNDVPEETPAVDLRVPSVMDRVQSIAREHDGVDVVIGGPPCQGFSNANRNSWSSNNPNNRLVETFLDYVVRLRPRVVIMENVQGILWTPRQGALDQFSVGEHVATRLSKAGYRIFPKLLDAAWYGVPQHRNRFFLLGLHCDVGYAQDDFGEWGPFPLPSHGPAGSRPYVSVREAIKDLPPIDNGASVDELPYEDNPRKGNAFLAAMRRWAPTDLIWDHVTSRHSEYVIDRYSRIPAGGNWSDIAEMMTNYAAVNRTHSNIYRRLTWDAPSITIGHYRKAMLVHPEQNRGLSLREASRLQSFPDWFRFAGNELRLEGGLTHKQQQLGNAVCPLVTRAIAEFLLRL